MGREFVAEDGVGVRAEIQLTTQSPDWFPPMVGCKAPHVQERAIDGAAGFAGGEEPGSVDED